MVCILDLRFCKEECIEEVDSVPPGFRFHPTDEELLYYYLRKKVAYEPIDLDVIREIDLNKLEPWDLKVNTCIDAILCANCKHNHLQQARFDLARPKFFKEIYS